MVKQRLTVEDVAVLLSTLKKDAVVSPKIAHETKERLYEAVLEEVLFTNYDYSMDDRLLDVQELAKEALKARKVSIKYP